MEHILDKIGLTYFWGKIKATFAKKSELEAHPTARIYMGSCSTAAATNPKVCTVEAFPLDANGKPLVGTLISVKFSATNTSTSTTPQLNVNDTGAIRIWYNNAVLATAKSAYAGYANRYINYMYDGTYWVFLGHSTDNNTTYSALTQAKIDAGTETTGRLISADLLRDNFYTEGEVDDLLASKANSNDLATVATSGSYNDLDDTPTIPSAVTESTVSGWGFTKNTGTITGITMNGASKGTSGVVNLGTVLTEHQSLAGKQDVISDLATIRSGAALGATAVQTETDPVYSASAASGITSSNITSWNGKAEKIAEINHGTSDTTFALTPNIHHVWGEVTSLTLTLATGEAGIANEYMFRFYSGSTPTTLNLPSTVQWVQPLTCQQDKYYEVSIIDNLAVYITSGMVAAESSGGTPEYATKDWVTNKIETEIDGGYYYV